MTEASPSGSKLLQALAQGVIAFAVFYAVDGMLLHGTSPAQTGLAGGILFAVLEFRHREGMQFVPDALLIAILVVGLVLYTAASFFFFTPPQSPDEWLPLALIYAVAAVLLLELRRRRARRQQSSEGPRDG